METSKEKTFIALSREMLVESFMPRIRLSVQRLSDEDLWWRPNEASNTIGNLILHLAGNLRQWIVAGVGGAADIRRRDEEFAARDFPTDEMLEELARAVEDAASVLSELEPSALTEKRTIQGREVSVLEAIYHAVEHFSMHTGQIMYITKMRLGEDLGFYRIKDGVPRRHWNPDAT